MSLTSEDLRSVAFSKPPIGNRGYNQREVDVLMGRVAAAFDGAHDPTLRHDVCSAAFRKPPLGQRGYNPDEVDAMLDLCTAELAQRAEDAGLASGEAQPSTPSGHAAPSVSSGDLRARHLPQAGEQEYGYHARRADKLVLRMAAALDGADGITASELSTLRPPRTKRPGRGYQVDAFDRLLREIEEELRRRGR